MCSKSEAAGKQVTEKSPENATSPRSGEVVVVIPASEPDECPAKDTLRNHGSNLKSPAPPSPDISSRTGSPNKLPPRPLPPQKPEEALLRRRTLSRSIVSKPKSRFVEQALPPAAIPSYITHDEGKGSPAHSGATKEVPKTPKTPVVEGEEDDEEEVYRREQLEKKGGRKSRACGIARILVEWGILLAAIACLVASLTVHRLQGFVIWGLEIWKWCVMTIVVFSGRLIAHWMVVFIVFLIERNFLFKKKVLYFVYGLKNSAKVCIWFGLVLLSWMLLFDHGVRRSRKTEKLLNHVSRALASLLIGSLLWLVKTVLVKLLAASFHVNTFFDRIQESVFHQYVLQVLSGPPVMELAEKVGESKSTGQLSFRSEGKGKDVKEQGVIDIAKLHKMRQEKVSAWTMKGLMASITSSGFLTISTVIDNSFETDDEGGGKKGEITNEWEAKAAAYRIFKNVAKPGHRFIDVEDLLRFLSKQEVEIMLPMFEGAIETGKIKKSAMKNWVVKAYLDRKSLAHSLNDTKTAVKQLHKLASVVAIVVTVVITLLLLGLATTQVLVLISSQLLLVAFMFGNTCKTVFEAIIFVFVMHPFDVGDRCVIDGVQMVVEEMNILTTVFLRFDNEKIFYPNSVLATKPISNFYRSPDMNDSVDFSIDFFTSVESIAALKSRIKLYIESKPTHWHPNHTVVLKDIVNVNRMNFTLNVLHTMNYQKIVDRNIRRSELVLELKRIFEELSIRYNLLPQEIHLNYASQDHPLPTRQ